MIPTERVLPSLPPIQAFYQDALDRDDHPAYLDALLRDGVVWLFELEPLTLAAHLSALPASTVEQSKQQRPLRLALFQTVVQATIPATVIEGLYAELIATGDTEAACAAVGAGITAILNSGRDFRRFEAWTRRIEALLDPSVPISPLARASLLGYRGLVEIVWKSDVKSGGQWLRSQWIAAAEAGSVNLRIFGAGTNAYAHIWAGDLAAAWLVLDEALLLCPVAQGALVPKVFLQSSLAIFHAVRGDALAAEQALDSVIYHPDFQLLPSFLWLLVCNYSLFAMAPSGDAEVLEHKAHRIRSQVIPAQNYFQQGYSYYGLGVAALWLGRPAEALRHAELFREFGRLSHSRLHERLPALLYCQALADLGRDEEALESLGLSLSGWHDAGYQLIIAAGAMEAAQIHLRRGNRQQARAWLETAKHALPLGEELPLLHRPASFREYLYSCLTEPEPHAPTPTRRRPPVWITTLGGLRIYIGGHVISAGEWRGGSTRKVLEALIVEGGHSVPAERLADMVWPDADTSRGRASLKVALSRLRHLGVEAGRAVDKWVQSHDGLVSLAPGICSVDALELQESLGKHSLALDRRRLTAALDLYQGDFLPGHAGDTWIVECRQRLRAAFIRGAHALAEASVRHEAIEEAQGYLERAMTIDPLDERTYELLMQGHLKLGHPARALRIYHEAERTLRHELGIGPGEPLRALAVSAGH